ncbi:MAG: hypothetical protein HY673_26405 [Chloroflexi bacterium]|nr:hypothetical protein [Chloroflexota bacterium]
MSAPGPSFQQAFSYFDIALSQEPRNASLYFSRAVVYLRAGKSPEEVLKELDRAIELHPHYIAAYSLQAHIERSRGSYADALAWHGPGPFPPGSRLRAERKP